METETFHPYLRFMMIPYALPLCTSMPSHPKNTLQTTNFLSLRMKCTIASDLAHTLIVE